MADEAQRLPESFDVPYRDALIGVRGMLSTVWTTFFRELFDRLQPLGKERSFPLANNTGPDDVVGLKVNSRAVSQAIVEYLVQRVTLNTGAVKLVESGSFLLTYNPTDEDWTLTVLHEEVPDDAGVTFTVSTAGQVKYQTSNVAGDPSISRMLYRVRTLAGKNTQYSSQGTR